MKQLLFIFLSYLAMPFAMAQTSDFTGKIINLGDAATTLEVGKWYVLFNSSTATYIAEGSGNTLGVTTTSPNSTDAQANAGYLVQLEDAGSEGKYYLKTGLGNYFQNVNTSANNGTSATMASATAQSNATNRGVCVARASAEACAVTASSVV